MGSVKILILTLIFSLPLLATTPVNDEAEVKQKIQQWYGQIGLSGKVSQDEFEATIRGYFHYRKKGVIPPKNVLAIVNYKIPSTEKRFFIFQIGDNAKMLREEWVSHGVNSGPPGGVTRSFSNVPESKQSSRGFYRSGETYHGKYGYSLRLDGMEQGINHKMRPRAVVLHGGKYAGYGQGGRSWGCLTVAMNRRTPVVNLLKGQVLIYGSDGESHSDYTFMGGTGSINKDDINGVPSTDNNPGEEVDSDYVSFSDIEEFQSVGDTSGPVNFGGSDYGAFGSSDAIPSIADTEGIKGEDGELDNTFSEDTTNPGIKNGTAPLHGTSEFEDCQNRASAPWDIVVAEAQKPGGDPSKFFAATYRRMENDVKNMDQVPDSVVKNMAIDNHAKNERCVALARMMKNSCNDANNPNEPETYAAKDGSVVCKKESAEAQDYCKCKDMVDAINDSLVAEANMNKDQEKKFVKDNDERLKAVQQSGNIQAVVSQAAQASQDSAANIAAERSDFQIAKLKTVDQMQAAMPNRNSLLTDCRGYMSGRDSGTRYLKAYVNHLDVQDKSVPKTYDPCLSVVKNFKTNLIQNIPARKQAIQVMERAGLKSLSLNSKERRLLGQKGLTDRSALKRTGDVGYGTDFGKFQKGGDHKFGFGANVDFSKQGCKGGNCDYKGGKGVNKRNRDRGGRNSGRFDAYNSIALPSNYGKGKNPESRILTFDEAKKKRGVYDRDFYQNVNLALEGKIAMADLTPAQRKEVEALMDYQKYQNESRSRGTGSSSAQKEEKGRKGKNAEIWFDKTMDLFKIISNRYKEAVKDNRL